MTRADRVRLACDAECLVRAIDRARSTGDWRYLEGVQRDLQGIADELRREDPA